MSVRTGCPHCSAELKLKSEKSVGRKVPCPKCSTPFIVKVLDEPAADEEWDEYDDYSEQDYGSSYDDYEEDSSSAQRSSRSSGKRTSGSKRTSGGRSRSRKSGSKKKPSNNGPNWVVIGGGIAGVLILIGGVVAFWPGGNPTATTDTVANGAASTESGTSSGTDSIGPYVTFLDGELRMQRPSGLMVTNPPGKVSQGLDQFAGFGREGEYPFISITSNGMPVDRAVELYTSKPPTGGNTSISDKTISQVDGKTDLLFSIDTQGTAGRFFGWTRIWGHDSWSIVVQSRMRFKDKETYSASFKEILQNAQFGPAGSNEGSAPVTQSAIPLAATEVNGIRLVPTKFLDGRIEMLAPADFTPMSDEMARLKYPTANRPSEIITNEAGSVNLAFTYSKQVVAPGQLGQMHASMDRMFRTTQTTAEWHNSGLRSINNRQWIELDLTMQAADTRIRNLMYGTSSGGRAALIAFNVTVEEEPQWIEAAKAMIASMHSID